MMEVTPHLKCVLKNYQHSATNSLHGPGLSLTTKNELSSPELLKEDEYVPPPFPVQQVPILTIPDQSCSERTETILHGESISCFVVGGEKRLCLPQVLKSVLGDFSLLQINQECDQLQIYCSRCTVEQLNVLKSQGILPSTAPSCGLITKTNAERLCSALLHGQVASPLRPHKGAASFLVYHECFGKCKGICYPELYTSKNAKCIECKDCQGGFSPQQFVCHVHRNLENKTVHWGFDSCNWRCYLHVSKDQVDKEQFVKCLDDMQQQYQGKMPHPRPQIDMGMKRKQVLANLSEEFFKTESLKKQKLAEYLHPLPYNLPLQQIYTSLDPVYSQYIQDFTNANRHLSAFKPVHQNIKESKIRHAIAINRYSDPPILQNPERVILMTDSERYERTYQPNVALAPPALKKHRFGKANEYPTIKEPIKSESIPSSIVKNEQVPLENHVLTPQTNGGPSSVIKTEEVIKKASEVNKLIESTVSVVQRTTTSPRYNSEIELSTDTEDSASEASEKLTDKLEDSLKSVDSVLRDRILEVFHALTKENERLLEEKRSKDNKITELELRNIELIKEIEDARAAVAKSCHNNNSETVNANSNHSSENNISSSNSNNNNNCIDNESAINNVVTDRSSNVKTDENCSDKTEERQQIQKQTQQSVITTLALVEKDVVVKIEPE